jgi:hypothetical protein
MKSREDEALKAMAQEPQQKHDRSTARLEGAGNPIGTGRGVAGKMSHCGVAARLWLNSTSTSNQAEHIAHFDALS